MRGNMEQEGMSLFMIPEVFSNTQSTAFHLSYFYYIKQVLGEDKTYDKKCDVYSYGLTVQSVDAEKLPFSGVKTENELHKVHVNGERQQHNPRC